MSESYPFCLIANEMWRERKVDILKMLARISSEGIACKSTGFMHGVVLPVSHMPSWCAHGQINVTFIRL
jgi:hypothetical protein